MRASDQFHGALWDIPTVALFLGEPLNSVRRWIHHPPQGFPGFLKIGRKIVFRAVEIRRWSDVRDFKRENESDTTPQPEASESRPTAKSRGRPRSQPKGGLHIAGA